MKYKYEFETEDFEKGDCYSCPLAYIEWASGDFDPHCPLHARWDECPLEEVVE